MNKLWEIIKVAFVSLHTNKLRSSLTMLGIIVGIFSIISISTIITMLQTSIEEGVSALGKNTFQLQKWPSVRTHSAEERAKIRNRKDITIEEYERLREELIGTAMAVGGEQWNGGMIIKYGANETNPNIGLAGCTIDAFSNNNWIVETGREFTQKEINGVEEVIVLGKDIADALFDFIDPVGQEVWMDGHKLKVLGVLESQGDVFGQSQDNFALIPLTTFQKYYGKRSNSINITIQAFDRESYDELIEITEGHFRTIRKVPPGEENDFEIRSNEQMLSQINDITSGVRIGSYVVAAIALLAAGVGIMNIMLVSVTERTKEIGIRKAIGAKKANVLFQFIVEAVTLSLAGGFVGIILGVVAGNVAGSFLDATAVFPVDWVAIGFTLCVIIGITFGTYPAYKAANLDPIEALRYE